MTDGRGQVTDGRWQMADDRWQMKDDSLKMTCMADHGALPSTGRRSHGTTIPGTEEWNALALGRKCWRRWRRETGASKMLKVSHFGSPRSLAARGDQRGTRIVGRRAKFLWQLLCVEISLVKNTRCSAAALRDSWLDVRLFDLGPSRLTLESEPHVYLAWMVGRRGME